MRRLACVSFLIASLLGGCVLDGDPGVFYISANQLVGRKTQCVIKAGGRATEVLPIGVLDLLQSNRYLMFPLVESGLGTTANTTNLSPDKLQLDTNTIMLAGAYVHYEVDGLLGPFDAPDDDGDGLPDEETAIPDEIFVPTSGTVKPGTPAVGMIEVIPPPVGDLLDRDVAFDEIFAAGYVVAYVSLLGFLQDGTEVRSGEFVFPVKVCRGCLVYWNLTPEACCQAAAAPENFPCFPGQDESSACQLACYGLYGMDREAAKKALLTGEITKLSDYVPTEAVEE